MDVRAGSALSGLLDMLSKQVAGDGIVVVRTAQRVSLLERYGEFGVIERRRWGTMAVTILRKNEIRNPKHETKSSELKCLK